MILKPLVPVKIKSQTKFALEVKDDLVVGEEPLEIRIEHFDGASWKETPVSITMRTPVNDFELAVGFLFAEGILHSHKQIRKIAYCEKAAQLSEGKHNVVRVSLNENEVFDATLLNRNFYMNSSCGICGKSAIDDIRLSVSPMLNTLGHAVVSDCLFSLDMKLNKEQLLFKHTGGIHAAALFTTTGELLCVREDIGRHNALDKLIGNYFLINELPLSGKILFLSGRAGYEMIQKAARAGIEMVVSVGAPSSLTVEVAKELNITLIGFLKNNRYNIYHDCGRVAETSND
jgi:FdhD protein